MAENCLNESHTCLFTINAVSIVLHELIEKLHVKYCLILLDFEDDICGINRKSVNINYPSRLSKRGDQNDFLSSYENEYKQMESKLKKLLKFLSHKNLVHHLEDEIHSLRNEYIKFKGNSNNILRTRKSSIEVHDVPRRSLGSLPAELSLINKESDDVFCEIAEQFIIENLTEPYITVWYDNQIILARHFFTKLVEDHEKEITYYKEKLDAERQVEHQFSVIILETDNYTYMCQEQMHAYDAKMDELYNKSVKFNDTLEGIRNQMYYLKRIYSDQANWLEICRKNDAANIIQKWWRQIYEMILYLRAKSKKKGKKGKKK